MKNNQNRNITLLISVVTFTAIVLSTIQLFSPKPMILLERFGNGLGWFEIIGLTFYAGFVTSKLSQPKLIPKWRVNFWFFFSILFFLQLTLGISGIHACLMTGKLHFPIPAMIIAGPIYRGDFSVMTIIFLSSILLAGPAWCSQLCYFGAIDAIASNGKTSRSPLKKKNYYKHSILAIIIAFALIYRFWGITGWVPMLSLILFAVFGFVIMATYSRKKGKMVHCSIYCPVGTVVNYLKVISPFRLSINSSCTSCMACTTSCKYDALNEINIKNLKPGNTCTLCGDCLSTCHTSAFQYTFFSLPPNKAHSLYLFITISLHVIFIGLARI